MATVDLGVNMEMQLRTATPAGNHNIHHDNITIHQQNSVISAPSSQLSRRKNVLSAQGSRVVSVSRQTSSDISGCAVTIGGEYANPTNKIKTSRKKTDMILAQSRNSVTVPNDDILITQNTAPMIMSAYNNGNSSLLRNYMKRQTEVAQKSASKGQKEGGGGGKKYSTFNSLMVQKNI